MSSKDGATSEGGFDLPPIHRVGQDRRRDDARLRTLVTMNADGLLVVGIDGVIRYCNPAAAQLLGHPPQQLVGHLFGIPILPGQTADIDVVCPTGGVGCVAELRATAIDWDGQPSYLLSLRDVTEQRRQRQDYVDGLERERESRRAAETAERRAAFLADVSTLLGATLDYATALCGLARFAVPFLANVCAVHLRDGDQVRLVAMAGASLDPVSTELIDRRRPFDHEAATGVAAVLKSGRTETQSEITDAVLTDLVGSSGEMQAVRAAGLRSVLIVPMASRGQTLGALALGRSERAFSPEDQSLAEDLARRAALAVDNGRLYRQLADADRRKDEFLAMLAHELRNPLAPLRNALYMLRQGDGHPAAKEWAWDVVNRQMRHLGRLVDGLLDVSRVTRGRVALQMEPVDVGALARRVIDAARPLFNTRGQKWAVRLPAEPVYVDGDPLRLEQVLANLLDNAARYTPPGGRIEVTVGRDGEDAIITVADTGVGIPADLLANVFDLFTQADRSLDRAEGGLGIGLTLVKRLVDLHGGRVAAHSDGVGTGSKFTVRLPAMASDGTASAAVQGRRVLVVDDNRDLAESLAMVLRLWGHEVAVAYDGPAALAAAHERPPEVVFLDIGLPHLDGFEVARRLREDPDLRRARIVAITGYGRDDDRRRAQDAGIDLHLTKPVDPSDLQPLLAETA
jgi:signal transduction histidine kinase/CheY-like chemotaxis protein